MFHKLHLFCASQIQEILFSSLSDIVEHNELSTQYDYQN